MPDNPNNWVNTANTLPPVWGAVVLAMAMSVLRVIYDEKETKPIRIIIESLMCGALTLTAGYGVMAMELSLYWAIFAGGMVGFFGVEVVRMLILKLLKKKVA